MSGQTVLGSGIPTPIPSSRPSRETGLEDYLSVSRINTFLACPRKYYYHYIARIPEEDTFYTARGKVVHSVCERFFDWMPPSDLSYPQLLGEMRKRAMILLDREWKREGIGKLWGNERLEQTRSMMERFVLHQKWKMDPIFERYGDPMKAWKFTRPGFTELHVIDDDLRVHGYIDAVIDKGPGELILVDYKTSSVFRFPFSPDYLRQMHVYALLYSRHFGRTPDLLALDYLMVGQTTCFPVTPDSLDGALELIASVRDEIRSSAMEDYSRNTKYRFCNYCNYRGMCLDTGGDPSSSREN